MGVWALAEWVAANRVAAQTIELRIDDKLRISFLKNKTKIYS